MIEYERLCITEYQGPEGYIYKGSNEIKLSSSVDKIVLENYFFLSYLQII